MGEQGNKPRGGPENGIVPEPFNESDREMYEQAGLGHLIPESAASPAEEPDVLAQIRDLAGGDLSVAEQLPQRTAPVASSEPVDGKGVDMSSPVIDAEFKRVTAEEPPLENVRAAEQEKPAEPVLDTLKPRPARRDRGLRDPNLKRTMAELKADRESGADKDVEGLKNEYNDLLDGLESEFLVDVTMSLVPPGEKGFNARSFYQENTKVLHRLKKILGAMPEEMKGIIRGTRFVPNFNPNSKNEGPRVAADKRIEFNATSAGGEPVTPDDELIGLIVTSLNIPQPAEPIRISDPEVLPPASLAAEGEGDKQAEPTAINAEPEIVPTPVPFPQVRPAGTAAEPALAADTGNVIDAEFRREGPDPATEQELRELLDLARIRYVQAKRVSSKFDGAKDANMKAGYKEAQREMEGAEAEYRKANAEYVGSNAERYLDEKIDLMESHLAERGKLDAGWVTTHLRKAYDYLGEKSVYNSAKRAGYAWVDKNWMTRAVAKSLNGRTAINAGLLATGLGNAYFGMHGVAGLAMLARSGASGAFSMMGSRGLLEMGRNYLTTRPLTPEEVGKINDLPELESRMAQIESKAFFDGGTYETIKNSPEYAALVARQIQLYQRYADPAERERVFAERLLDDESLRDTHIGKERRGRRATMVGGAIVGAAVGGWAAKNAVDSWTDTHEFGPDDPAKIELKKAPEPLSPPEGPDAVKAMNFEGGDAGLSKTAGPEVPDAVNAGNLSDSRTADIAEEARQVKEKLDQAYAKAAPAAEAAAVEIDVTSRGVEGTLLDLKSKDPDRYTSMMAWLHDKYGGSASPDGSYIHRAVVEMAQKDGYTVDGGGLDLSNIDSAKIRFGADGSFSMDKPSLDFAGTPDAADSAHAATQKLEGLKFDSESVGSEDIKTETLDFRNLSNTFEETKEAVGSNLRERRYAELFEKGKGRQMGAALRDYMRKEYKPFVEKILHATGPDLNRIQRMSVREFLDQNASRQSPPNFTGRYKGLFEAAQKYLAESNTAKRVALQSESMRQLLIRMAHDHLERVRK